MTLREKWAKWWKTHESEEQKQQDKSLIIRNTIVELYRDLQYTSKLVDTQFNMTKESNMSQLASTNH